jgi:antitoxin (DNA-binding transcriptional repressor) of toxin-antitoxin stability system
METVNIRNLRGKYLREKTEQGKPLAITKAGALIGVVIPVASAWVENLIDYNWSHVRQSITEGEQAAAAGTRLTTLADVVGDAEAADDTAGHGWPEKLPEKPPEKLGVPTVVAALTGRTVAQAPESKEILARLQQAFNPSADPDGRRAGPAMRTVRVGDLSADEIERAGRDGQTLAVTHNRRLTGIIIPVTRDLVEFLIEQNMSRILQNIALSEKISARDQVTTLDQILGARRAGAPSE